MYPCLVLANVYTESPLPRLSGLLSLTGPRHHGHLYWPAPATRTQTHLGTD